MRTAMTAFVAIVTLGVVSCSSIAPVKVIAGDQCFQCRRNIADVRLAGEIVGSSGLVSKFRAPGCMAKYLAAHPCEDGAVYVTDYTSGTMMSPKAALFVRVVLNRDTGERDYRAYRGQAEADAAALETHTVPFLWDAVLAAVHE